MKIPAHPHLGKTPTRFLIPILGLLSAFGSLSTDMYLSGFPEMSRYFGVKEGAVEITLSTFFLGMAVGQAIYGPLVDRYGRRKPLILGVCLYVVSVVLCLLTSSIHVFTALRFLQALGGCTGMIVGRAIISDLFDERESAKALSFLMIVVTLCPILAPIIGGFTIEHAGWKAAFAIMLVVGLLCLALTVRFIPETLSPERRSTKGLVEILVVWRDLLLHRKFVVPAMVGGFAQSCLFSFITGSPYVLRTMHGLSSQTYGFMFAIIACALIVSAQLNRMSLNLWGPRGILTVALIGNVIAGVVLNLVVPTNSLVWLMIPLWFVVGSLGFIGANAAAVAMSASQGHFGLGSALVGVLQFSFAFAMSSVVAAAQNGTAYPMTLAMLCCGAIANILWLVFYRPWEHGE